jgi:transcriptional regulator with GAF, ATPase, and Fis domain
MIRSPFPPSEPAAAKVDLIAANLSAGVLSLSQSPLGPSDFLRESLTLLLRLTSGDFAAVVLLEPPSARVLSEVGARQTWPPEIVAECLDRDEAVEQSGWLAMPLAPRGQSGEVLLAHYGVSAASNDKQSTRSEQIKAAAEIIAAGLRIVRRREQLQSRVSRAETLLSIVQHWGRTQEMETLLAQMAEASTRLLEADRASIFLWDRAAHVLVGRPALGVEAGELRVPDDAGVVGEVLRSGQPRRVSLTEKSDPVNRLVDNQLKYKTRTLLAVPLRAPGGELLGVFEVINKRAGEFTADDESVLIELAGHAAVALENTQDRQKLLASRKQMVDQAAEHVRLVGNSPAIEALRSTVRRVADTDLAVLLLGANGTGKEVVSQLIHYLSRRRDEPFIAVNCAAITETLLESELFGHEKGSFTDAHESRPGKFELANGGTLFLDEIGDMSLSGQGKLLRVVEEKVVVRVGGSRPIPVDVRVIAATNQQLANMVRAKKFREDLYFRLNVVVLELPPLADRGEDVLLLAEHFLADFSRRARRKPPRISAEAKKRLMHHTWPGNVRELRNLMERVAFLAPGDTIEPGDLAFISSPAQESPGLLIVDQPLSSATDRFQAEYVRKAIQRAGGNMTDAAELLGLHRSNLYRKMKQLGMEE